VKLGGEGESGKGREDMLARKGQALPAGEMYDCGRPKEGGREGGKVSLGAEQWPRSVRNGEIFRGLFLAGQSCADQELWTKQPIPPEGPGRVMDIIKLQETHQGIGFRNPLELGTKL